MAKRKKNKNKNNSNPFAMDSSIENLENNLDINTQSIESADNSEKENVFSANEQDSNSEEANNTTDNQDEVIFIEKDENEETDSKEEDNVKEDETNEKSEKKGLFDNLFNNKKAEEELKKVKESFSALNNQYIRLAADFDNYRKRQESERESLIKFGKELVLKNMIEIADNFDRAEKAIATITDCEKAKEAFDVIKKQFKTAINKLGLEEIQAEGNKFDPNFHEAVMQIPTTDIPEDTVIQEMQKGYKFEDRVLRPSMVSVSVSK